MDEYIDYTKLSDKELSDIFRKNDEYSILGTTVSSNPLIYEVIKRNLLFLFNEKSIMLDFFMLEYAMLTNNKDIFNKFYNDIFIKDIIDENIDILKNIKDKDIMLKIFEITYNDSIIFEKILYSNVKYKYDLFYDIILKNKHIKPKRIEFTLQGIKNEEDQKILNLISLLYLKDTNIFYDNSFDLEELLINNIEKMYKDINNDEVYNYYFLKYMKNSENLKNYYKIHFNDNSKGYA